MSHSSSFNVSSKATQQVADDGAGAATHVYQFPPVAKASGTMADGSGANKLNKLYQKTHTIAAGGTLTLILGDGSLLDKFGNALAFTKVREFGVVHMGSTDGDDITIGAAGTDPWTSFLGGTTPTVKLEAGGLIFMRAPLLAALAVGAGNRQLKFSNPGGNSVDLNIYFAGE